MYKKIKSALICSVILLITGCGAYFNQPYKIQDARIGELASKTQILRDFPLPFEQVVVGVYNFKDQTGQYKAMENGSSFSTAVSQGATTMLIQALEDSKWFTPIERENLSNLLNERNIIRSTRDEFQKRTNTPQPALPPLLYAGVLLEGGVVSYDSNVITGGAGARYFGVGGSTQYREDRISIYLRAVSTSNGKILKTVYVSKTILSQSVDASLFRYVSFQRLLEAETGFTKNEPVQLAMKDAIEKAVEGLIIEGIEAGLWTSADGGLTNKKLMDAYKAEKEYEESTLLYDRKQIPVKSKNAIVVNATVPRLNADLSKKSLGAGASLAYSRVLSPHANLNLDLGYLYITGGSSFYREYMSSSLNLEFNILPYDNFAPFVYGGGGIIFDIHNREEPNADKLVSPKLQVGLGFNAYVSEHIDLRFFAESNFTFTDELDNAVSGTRDDYYYNFGVGLKYKFGLKKNNTEIKD